jgi:hypothetical protein
MDQLMVDVTGLDDLKIGDVAIIFGEGSEIDVQDFARVNNTIPYEIFCNIGARVTRIYKNEFSILKFYKQNTNILITFLVFTKIQTKYKHFYQKTYKHF